MMITKAIRVLAAILPFVSLARDALSQTTPLEGIRKNTPAVHAFINARIIQSPGKVIDNGTLVMRDGVIESVGSGGPPKDARVWDLRGMSVYAELIDSHSDHGLPKPPP